MTEVPLITALAFMGVVGASAFMCSNYLEKLNHKIDRQNELLGRIMLMIERKLND